MLSHTPLTVALDEILSAVRTVLPHSDTSIMLVQDGELFTFETHELPGNEIQIRFALGDGLVGWCAETGQAVRLNDPPLTRATASSIQRQRSERSYLCRSTGWGPRLVLNPRSWDPDAVADERAKSQPSGCDCDTTAAKSAWLILPMRLLLRQRERVVIGPEPRKS